MNFTRFIWFLVASAEQPQWSECRVQLIDILDNRLWTPLLFAAYQSLSHSVTLAHMQRKIGVFCFLFERFNMREYGRLWFSYRIRRRKKLIEIIGIKGNIHYTHISGISFLKLSIGHLCVEARKMSNHVHNTATDIRFNSPSPHARRLYSLRMNDSSNRQFRIETVRNFE